jgi:hypothetical protein
VLLALEHGGSKRRLLFAGPTIRNGHRLADFSDRFLARCRIKPCNLKVRLKGVFATPLD